MKRSMILLTSALAFAAPVSAGLPTGAVAPDFTARGALGGKVLTFSLKKELKKGPVVLYFFPAAFTAGCTLEAHKFAEATASFKRLGATIVGVTAGNVERVAEFSKSECRSKFAVAADPGARIATQYRSTMSVNGKLLSDRTSYVIAPDGKILLSYTDGNPEHHVDRALDAVRAWRARRT